LTPLGKRDVFICKLDSSGNLVWVKDMGGAGAACGSYSLALDHSNNIYATGYFGGTVDFDPGSGVYNQTSAGGRDISFPIRQFG